MFCNECGASNPDAAKFCSGCGTALSPTNPTTAVKPPSPAVAPVQVATATHGTPPPASSYKTIGANPTIAGAKTASAQALLPEGKRFNGRYDIVRLVGRGGMGEVYQAHDNNLQLTVALKVLSPNLQNSPEAVERFVREAQISLRLSHKNIVRVYDMFVVGPLRCISMEYIDGMDFRRYLDTRAKSGPPLTVKEVRVIGQMICDAMDFAHEITVHRDLKPENILVTRDAQIKVSDFGIAKVISGSQMQMTSSVLGTAYYMAPEQSTGATVDRRADIYSLGVILYEALVGRLPIGRFKGPKELRGDVPDAVNDVIMAALETDPNHRPASMAVVRDALALNTQKAAAVPATPPAPASKGSLKGAAAAQARELLEKQKAIDAKAGNKMLNVDMLVNDETYRANMVQNSLQFCSLAKQSLSAAGYEQAAKAIEETQVGLFLLIGGWHELAKTNQGLALSMLQLNMFGYYMCVTLAVRAIGLGDVGEGEKYDEAQFVQSILSMTTTMKEQIITKLQQNQKKQGGFLKRFFS